MDARHPLAGAAGADHQPPQLRGFSCQGLPRSVRAEDDVRRVVEVAGAAFKQVRHAVDQDFKQPREDVRRCKLGAGADFRGHRVERRRLRKTHGQQNMFGQRKSGRGQDPGLVFPAKISGAVM